MELAQGRVLVGVRAVIHCRVERSIKIDTILSTVVLKNQASGHWKKNGSWSGTEMPIAGRGAREGMTAWLG